MPGLGGVSLVPGGSGPGGCLVRGRCLVATPRQLLLHAVSILLECVLVIHYPCDLDFLKFSEFDKDAAEMRNTILFFCVSVDAMLTCAAIMD